MYRRLAHSRCSKISGGEKNECIYKLIKEDKEDLNFCISTVCWLYGKIQFSKGNRYLGPKLPINAVRTDGGGMCRGLLSAEE